MNIKSEKSGEIRCITEQEIEMIAGGGNKVAVFFVSYAAGKVLDYAITQILKNARSSNPFSSTAQYLPYNRL